MATADPHIFTLDRRAFLRLAGATGAAAIGSASLAAVACGQSPNPSATTVASDPLSELAASLGHDPDRIFAFVRDEVRYEPYPGVLRGARGTLSSRGGSSADQALLLADLLRASGVPVRFVMGALDPGTRDEMMAATVVDAPTASRHAEQLLVSDEDVATGLSWTPSAAAPSEEQPAPPTLADLRSALETDRAATADLSSRFVQDALGTITTALAGTSIELPTAPTTMPQLEMDRHTWVQAGDGSGWLDLDPTVPGAEPGATFAAAGDPLDVLPDELRHRIDFKVVAETLVRGGLTRSPVLEVSAFADELHETGILFTHVPSGELRDFVDLIGGGVGQGTPYSPVLVIGGRTFVSPAPVFIGGGGGGDLLGGALGGGGEGIVEGETGAEWLKIQITPPLGEAVPAQRTIFDRIGLMRETGLDPYAIWPAEFIDQGDGSGAHFLPLRGFYSILVTAGPVNLKSLIEKADLLHFGLLPLVTGLVDALRDGLALDVAPPLGVRPFTDSPSVTSLVFEARPDGYEAGLDIWHRSVGSLGVAGGAPAVPPAMLRGIIPHAVERVVMGEGAPAGAAPASGVVSVGAIFDAAASQAVPTLVLVGSIPAPAPFTPELRASIQTALDDGYIVVVPARVIMFNGRPRLGWWLIDPVTGATADQRDDGRGASTAETKILIATASMWGSIIAQRAQQLIARNPQLLRDAEFMRVVRKLDLWMTIIRATERGQ